MNAERPKSPLVDIEVSLSPAGQAALARLTSAKRENGSTAAPHFALRRRSANPTRDEQERELSALFPEHRRRPVSRAELNQQVKLAIFRARDERLREEKIQKRLKELRALAAAAKAAWLAFNGQATQEQVNTWNSKYGKIYMPGAAAMKPVNIVSALPLPPCPVPTEIVERHKREREQYEAAILGPLPNHPELPIGQAETLAQFWAHLPSGKIIHESSRGLWAAGSFDKHCGRIKDVKKTEGPGMLASTWLSQFRAVQSLGWDPGEAMIIEGRILKESGWVHTPGSRSFNTYLPPAIVRAKGDVAKWLDHLKFMYPSEADHIVLWFAHRVQRPGDKVNHGLVFIGDPGIGKDTAIEPVIAAIGAHNFRSITAARFFKSDFNGYLKSVMLRIDEVHDLGGESKYAFHDRTKPVLAAPPAAHEINEKFVPHHSARNVCGVILTSNHADALYLDRNDRRHFVCISDRKKEDFPDGYFDSLYAWFENGGNEAVAHFLANLDLSAFNAKAPPPKTAGWHSIVAAGLSPESGDLSDVIEAMGRPAALTLPMVKARTPGDSQLRLSFEDAKLRRAIPKRLGEAGYIAVANPDARDSGGRWRMLGGKTTIYALRELSETERLAAARMLSASALLPPIPPPPR